MTNSTKDKPTNGTAAGGVLACLTQQQASWLIGKPAVWLRDNAHVAGRNADGTYDARELVAAMRTEFKPAELPDAEHERVLQVVEAAYVEATRLGAAVRILRGVLAAHGAAGLAAIGRILLDVFEEMLRTSGSRPLPAPKSRATLEAEAAERIEAILAQQASHEALAEFKELTVCYRCRKYRFGRTWKRGSVPAGYVPFEDVCPRCAELS